MKVGYFANVNAPGRYDDFARVLDETRELALACEELGYDSIWFGEHHFGHEGIESIPNPILMSADIAARTSRIRIGQSANIITFWHPVRLAEDIALLDQLSHGRIEVGVGRGVYGREAVNMNNLADLRNPAQNFALFEETYTILVKALSEPFFAHQGQFYTFPAPGVQWNHPLSPWSPDYMDMERGEIARLGVRPRPYQQPHPPLWMVLSAAPQALRWAAAHGVKGMFWMPTVKELKHRFETYREIASEVRGTSVPLGADLAVMRDCYVAETMEEARRDFEEAILTSYRWITHWRGLGNLMDPGEELQPGTELTYELLHERNLLVGTPDYVAEKIRELQSELNLQYLLAWTMHPGMTQEKLLRSLRLFGTEVLPRVQGAREAAAVR